MRTEINERCIIWLDQLLRPQLLDRSWQMVSRMCITRDCVKDSGIGLPTYGLILSFPSGVGRWKNKRQDKVCCTSKTCRCYAHLMYINGSPYSITGRRVPELIPVLGSQPTGDVSHKPGSRLPLLSARPAVTPATLKRAATCFAAWWTEAQWVWAVCLRLLPDSVATAIWTRALLCLSPAR